MPRPREFDETTALDAAIACFWHRGYEATSVRDLAGAMGISGPSLYNAFGDKRALFVAALERYLNHSTRSRIKRLEDSLPPKRAVRRFIEEIIERSLSDRERRGCFLINSALEVAPHDRELGALIADRLGEIEAFFRRSIEAAQADGTVPSDRSPGDLAKLLLGVLLGIRVLARSKPERALLEGVARPALALLDYPTQLQTLLRAKGIDAQVVNAGVPFDTTAMMLRRIDKDVPNGTEIAILQPGGNDRRRFFVTKQQRATNIGEMERRLRARGIKVIVYDDDIPLRASFAGLQAGT